MCICVYVFLCVCVYTHTHTHTPSQAVSRTEQWYLYKKKNPTVVRSMPLVTAMALTTALYASVPLSSASSSLKMT